MLKSYKVLEAIDSLKRRKLWTN